MVIIFVTPFSIVTHLDSAEPRKRERVQPIFSDLFSRLARRLFFVEQPQNELLAVPNNRGDPTHAIRHMSEVDVGR
jgi:hypothetical protein